MAVMETTKAQVTAIPYVEDDLCRSCRKCLARDVCRSKAILQIDQGEPPFIDPSRCYGCRACIPACPYGAIVLNGPESDAI
ncbi:MAG TPA: 4Fe-4S binding protein [Anaerolineae bacterium]|nr:4Fe-4S binding protein [Anaerolineae bacterium]